ncbi:cell wall-binding repeat-containing protein [Agromyces sp. SYSU K20354]|uniref:peroxidase family protein n=1 Tax=Agromyces cavernae TaxID=2898659 RepID=UPI001E36BA7B|nr:peroxidase family protein [Agromyces cavernae]MCD2442567.1 cell wall-binding repeat-containing protein [Agromyces cavernae]
MSASPGISPFSLRRRPESRLQRTLIALLALIGLIGTISLASVAPPAQAVTDEDPAFVLNQNDLEFILRQIQISEAHAADALEPSNYELLCSDPDDSSGKCVPNVMNTFGVRTVDGTYNNLVVGQSEFGASDSTFPRLLEPEWRQGETVPAGAPANNPANTAVCANPGPPSPAARTCYSQTEGFVYDSEPRTVSNLIVDQTTNNPAILNQLDAGTATIIPGTDRVVTPNTTADEELSAPFNTFMGFFGQFFDHGLDLIAKGGHGTLVVPLEEDDPLYDPDSNSNFLMLTRADRAEDAAGNATNEYTNLTTPFIDQNQTYSSHPSHQVFLRAYGPDGTDTGRLIEGDLGGGERGGMATWNDVKAQARNVLGINLTDDDVLAVPQILTDPYGNFVPGPERGLPQLIVATDETVDGIDFVEGDTAAPISTANALSTGHAFLDDIAHGATPLFDAQGNLVPLQFGEDGNVIDPGIPLFDAGGAPVNDSTLTGYDNVALGEHFIAGDGRVNENIGLTAVHSVFHAEHNRMAGQIERLLAGEMPELLNDQTVADPAQLEEFGKAFRGEDHAYRSAKAEETLPGAEADDWTYQQRLFQAAKFATEMQYQHLVFEEFARKVAPTIDAVVFNENSYNAGVDAAITAEFSQVVYRFGHSMMTEEIGRESVVGGTPGLEDVPLLDGFLNPEAFDLGGTLSPEEAAGSIVNGTTARVGSQIDEHIVDTLRNSLLGLPLDLATINLLRGRDLGIPGLQAARTTFFEATGDADLKPYANWTDFGLNIKNGNNFGRGGTNASLVNFVAAYGSHPTVTAATTIEAKRDAAALLVNGAIPGEEFISRYPGSDRFHTAQLISERHFAADSVQVAYVANGMNFPDALAGGALNGPILLTANGDTGELPLPTRNELLRLNPDRIVVLGGPSAVGPRTVAALNALSASDAPVTRLSGADRFATAVDISAETFDAPVDRVFIANGLNFPDALAGAAVAARDGSPILLVRPNAIPGVVRAELDRLNPEEIVVLGSSSAVSTSVQRQLDAYASGDVVRLGGASRYETAIAISKHFFPTGADRVYLATGANFPDALAAAAAAGINHAPILLVPPTGLTPALRAELTRLAPAQIHILGGTSAVSQGVELALARFAPVPLKAPADRLAFMNGTGRWANVAGQTVTGLEDVEFWIGGLAERLNPFGGMLGSTFNYVFESQLEALQFGDRFYYLFRNQGEQLFAALEGNTFSDMIQRNTDASNLPADIFAWHEPGVDLDIDDLPNPVPAGLIRDGDGTWRWSGDEHVELHGGTGDDRLRGDEGDDAIWGYQGDDRIEGGAGNDALVGGPGHDIITDSFGDDNIKGMQGNDAIHIGPGVDLGLGGLGDDFIVNGGGDGSTFFAGMGNDIVLGTSGRTTVIGGEHEDWVEGSSHADLLQGDNADQFQNDVIGGNDVVMGRLGNDDIEGEGGDDVLIGAAVGTDRHLGNIGFDWLTYYGQTQPVTSDWSFTRTTDPNNPLPSRFDQLEALSGGAGNDTLRGPLVEADDIAPSEIPLHKATEETLAMVDGLTEMLRPTVEVNGVQVALGDFSLPILRSTPDLDADGVHKLMIGGPGSDTIEGRGGNDYLDGDAMLRVQLENTVTGQRFDSAAQLQAAVFNGTLNPGDIEIVREIVYDESPDAVDTAFYRNPFASYTITQVGPAGSGYWRVEHTQVGEAEESDGVDVIRGFERLQFADGCATLNAETNTWDSCEVSAVVTLDTADPFNEGTTATANLFETDGVTPFDTSAVTALRYSWWAGEGDTPETVNEWEEVVNPAGSGSNEFVLTNETVGMFIRVTVSYVDADGFFRTATSATSPATVVNVNQPGALTLGSAVPQVGVALAAGSPTDGDGFSEDGQVFTYQWARTTEDPTVGGAAPTWTPIDGATGNTYSPVAEDQGSWLQVTIGYTDLTGTAEVVSAHTTTAVQAAPTP